MDGGERALFNAMLERLPIPKSLVMVRDDVFRVHELYPAKRGWPRGVDKRACFEFLRLVFESGRSTMHEFHLLMETRSVTEVGQLVSFLLLVCF